tara:strand:+ start:1225 stop:1785 length:561 start_codon:yes stop_codon:yes gene_type:complete
MKIKKEKIEKIKKNEDNPRFIREPKFNALVKSIQDFPEMLDLRPIVVDEDMIVLGGNMRLRACIEAGLSEVPVMIAEGLTPDQKKEFIVKDNVGFGQWDFDMLANTYDSKELLDWGMDVPQYMTGDDDLKGFFDDDDKEHEETLPKIILEYTQEDFDQIIIALDQLEGSKESIIFDLVMDRAKSIE